MKTFFLFSLFRLIGEAIFSNYSTRKFSVSERTVDVAWVERKQTTEKRQQMYIQPKASSSGVSRIRNQWKLNP